MRVSQEHYSIISGYMEAVVKINGLDKVKRIYTHYIEHKNELGINNPQVRLVWDMCYTSGLSSRMACDEWYKDFEYSDAHITTALIKAVTKLGIF